MRIPGPIYIISALTLLICSCGKDEEPTSVGGKGGNAILRVHPKHHSVYIDSCTVYIKYNSLDAATTYDDSVKCIRENDIPVAVFSGLKKGNYYLYGSGWDTAIQMAVIGGLPYTITEEATHTLNVPVTEGD